MAPEQEPQIKLPGLIRNSIVNRWQCLFLLFLDHKDSTAVQFDFVDWGSLTVFGRIVHPGQNYKHQLHRGDTPIQSKTSAALSFPLAPWTLLAALGR